MTTIHIELSNHKKAELSKPGVNAYAVYFTANTGPDKATKPEIAHWTAWSSTGAPGESQDRSRRAFHRGKVYVLIQSEDPARPLGELKEMITEEARIQWSHTRNGLKPGDKGYDARSGALQQDYSYDSFELTLTPVASDQGNLTSVNGFGTPM